MIVRRNNPMERPVGLEEALSEMGPNHATEFADALEIEGHPKPEEGFFPMWKSIGDFRITLVDFLQGKDHAFIGGVAARSYGARQAPTQDYDVMIAAEHLQEATSFLEKHGAELAGSVEDTCLFVFPSLKLSFDLRVARSPMDREALQNARGASFEGRRLRIVTPDYLAAMKVKAYSERKEREKGVMDAADVRGLDRIGATTRSAIAAILKKHRPELMETLDEILRP